MVVEACMAWDPIPEEANEFWNVDVVHVEESSLPDKEGGLALIIASQWRSPGHEDSWIRKAWRVRIQAYQGYRMRTIGYAGNPPLTRPDQRKAIWEISPSNYLIEEGVPDGLIPGVAESVRRYHHFVILTGGNTVYEAVAATWTCEPVGDEWAHPFQQVPQ